MLINFPLNVCADSHCWKIGNLIPVIVHGSQVPNQCYESLHLMNISENLWFSKVFKEISSCMNWVKTF